MVKKLPTKKLFKTKNIQEVLDILNSPEKSPTKSIGSPTKSATSDWTESFDEEENEEEIPEEITGPVIPTLPNAKEIPQFHEVGEMKPQKVMKVAEEIKTEEIVTSPVKSPKVVASPEKRMLRTVKIVLFDFINFPIFITFLAKLVIFIFAATNSFKI